MSKSIYLEMKERLAQEKAIILQQECAKVEQDMIRPKFLEIENELSIAVATEIERHNKELENLTKNANLKKEEYANRINGSVEGIIETKYHYAEQFKAIDKLLEIASE